jgi:hypothetical protein
MARRWAAAEEQRLVGARLGFEVELPLERGGARVERSSAAALIRISTSVVPPRRAPSVRAPRLPAPRVGRGRARARRRPSARRHRGARCARASRSVRACSASFVPGRIARGADERAETRPSTRAPSLSSRAARRRARPPQPGGARVAFA